MADRDDNPKREQTRRKFLKSAATLGAAGAAATLPKKWTKPVLKAIVTPAHAATSGKIVLTTTAAPTTPAPTTTAPPKTTTGAPTTPAPTTTAPPTTSSTTSVGPF